MRVFNMYSQPGVPPDIDPDRAIERTNPALHAAGWFRDDMTGGQNILPMGLIGG
jgi:hypothetical protein